MCFPSMFSNSVKSSFLSFEDCVSLYRAYSNMLAFDLRNPLPRYAALYSSSPVLIRGVRHA